MTAQIARMKVLHLFDTINRGGAEILALDVCRNAADFDIDLTFVTMQSGELEAEFRASDVKFIRLKRRLPIDFGAILKLRKIIKNNAIQIVHAHQGVDGLHLYLATVGLPVKRVLTFSRLHRRREKSPNAAFSDAANGR